MAGELLWETKQLNVGAIDVHSTYPEVSEINYLLTNGNVEKVMAYLCGKGDIFNERNRKAYDAYIDAREPYIHAMKDANVDIVTLWSALGEIETSKAYIKNCDRHFMTMDRAGEVPEKGEYYNAYKSYIEQLDVAFLSGSYGSKCVFSAAKQMKRINPELVILAVDGPIIWGPNPGTIYKEIGAHIIPNNQLGNEIAFLKNNYKINGAGPRIPKELLDEHGLLNRAIKVQQIERGTLPANTNQAEIIC